MGTSFIFAINSFELTTNACCCLSLFCVVSNNSSFYIKDQAPSFPLETFVSIIEEELGGSVNEIFDRFDYEPIAAGSLGNF